MFERHSQPVASRRTFLLRLARSMGIAAGILFCSLGLGVLGYHLFAHLSWVDALLNASMILTGMGPVDRLETTAAKLFASFYALFSGIIFISSVGVLVAPAVHRFLHKLHAEVEPARAQPKAGSQTGQKKKDS